MAQEDLERLKVELQLRDDATCGTKGDAASIISGATHTTLGNSSLRSVTEQDLNRDLEQACIANAKRMEAEAAARWGDLDALRADATETAPSKSPTITPSTPPIPTHGGDPAAASAHSSQSKSPASGSSESSTTNGEPASTKQRDPGNDPSISGLSEGAEGPRGPN
jgi:hypothetical protein